MQKTILITGGAGFIGSHLCDFLIKDGHKVICVDSFFSGKKENIAHLLKNKNFTLLRHNIIYPIKQKFDNIDEIYNLACPASPMQYQFDPILTMRTSVDGARNMLNLARKYNVRFLQASTSEVYGDPLEHPQKEGYFGNVDPLGKRSCYDEGKRAAESLCKDYNEQYGVDTRIIRLFNIYGPRMMFNDGRVISNFILQAVLGDDITVHGNGHQSRSFMYIDDLIVALDKLMKLSKEKIGLTPINLGNPDERSIESLALDIKAVSQSHSNVVYLDYDNVPERWGDPQKRCPDISRARKLLDWEPKIDFNQGLKRVLDDFNKRLKNKTKLVVFAPSYYPFEGPAEQAVKEITERLIGYDFDLIVAKMKPGLPAEEKIGRVTVHRLGGGTKFDKYFLPILGLFKAISLNKKQNYQAAWGIMASYGSLAAVLFSLFSNRALLVSLYEGKIDEARAIRTKVLQPFYRFIFKKAHSMQVVGDLTQQQLAWLEDDKSTEGVDLDKGWEYVSKKTKEKFQELEILSSRL
ncbi:SDR family oxidoreductase [bacterium]|nr:SDR family oxidoreductase [bacterium]